MISNIDCLGCAVNLKSSARSVAASELEERVDKVPIIKNRLIILKLLPWFFDKLQMDSFLSSKSSPFRRCYFDIIK